MSQIQIRDEYGRGVPLMNIRIATGTQPSDAALFDVFTDYAGNTGWPIPFFPQQPYALHVNFANVQPGYVPQSYYLTASDVGDVHITLATNRNGQEHGQLRVQGRDFISEDGQPWQFRGYTMHYLLKMLIEGHDVDRMFDEPIELGYNSIIVIGMHASDWKTQHGWRCTPIEHPDWFVKLAELFDRAAARQIRIAYAPLADMQYLPSSFDKQWYWRESCAVMAGRWNVIARKGNESRHNGWHQNEYQYPDMRGVLRSHGSKGGEKNPIAPYLDFEEFEVRRDLPKMFVDAPLRQLNDGDFEGANGPINKPIVSIEPIYFHDTNPDNVGDGRSTDPRVALELGVLTGTCAGGGFGASDGLECKRLGPIARQCAAEYIRGLRAGFVRPLAALDFQGDH